MGYAISAYIYSVLMYLGIVTTAYATSFFTPTILNQLGPDWTVVRSQVMTIPIYVTATIIALVTAVLTDRFKHRFTFVLIGCCAATVGYAMLLSMDQLGAKVRYAALFFVIGGSKYFDGDLVVLSQHYLTSRQHSWRSPWY